MEDILEVFDQPYVTTGGFAENLIIHHMPMVGTSWDTIAGDYHTRGYPVDGMS